jgi:2-polyprenyl-3-methyl-5-hydroxy-6-metoxy-1,4-benzoquinol methylase
MNLESTNCYHCGQSETAPWGSEGGYRMGKCAGCGLVYLNPRPALGDIDEAARTGLHKAEEGGLNVVGSYSVAKMRAYCQKLATLFPVDEAGGTPVRWLDVGAGQGELVQAVRELGYEHVDAEGVEPCGPKVEQARRRGLPVSSRKLAELEGPYTHVSLIDVYSHLPDPVAFLRELRRLLHPDGQLLLVTGNGADIPREEFPGALYLPDHLSFAGEAIVTEVLDRAGFRVTRIEAYAEAPSVDSRLLGALKNAARRLLGRPTVSSRIPRDSRFRSLWVRAQRV